MNHLRGLRKVDQVYALFTGLIGGVCVVGLGAMTAFCWGQDAMLGWIMAGSTAFTAALTAAMVVLLVMAGRRVEQGRWRVVQTVLALLSVGSNPPLGAAHGVYSLWVCWVEPASKAAFDSGGRAVDPPPPAAARGYRIAMRLIVIFGILYTLVTAVAFAGVGSLLAWGELETEVVVTDSHVEITGMYGERIARADLLAVELRDELPDITLRTNGFALGQTLKGWFATRDLGRVKLFVEADSPPFVYLETAEHWVICGEEPERTRAVYEALAASP